MNTIKTKFKHNNKTELLVTGLQKVKNTHICPVSLTPYTYMYHKHKSVIAYVYGVMGFFTGLFIYLYLFYFAG